MNIPTNHLILILIEQITQKRFNNLKILSGRPIQRFNHFILFVYNFVCSFNLNNKDNISTLFILLLRIK